MSQEQAETHAEAARDFVMGESVTKSDLQSELRAVRSDLQAVKSELHAAMDALSLRLTLRLSVLLTTGIDIPAALIKL